jgi:hypothetical protein
MKVGLGDAIEQLLKTKGPCGHRLDEQPSVDKAHLDRRAIHKADLLCERLGDPDS